jgi:uncharacterized protein (DUF1501 family)
MTTTRRGFIQQSAALGASAAAPWMANLAAIGDAAAQTAVSDYKALVCVFLAGGNDHANTLVPIDLQATGSKPGYDTYIRYRPEIAYQWDAVRVGAGAGQALLRSDRASLPGASNMLPLSQLVAQDAGLSAKGRSFAFSPPLTELKQLYDGGQLAVLLNVGTLVEPTRGYRAAPSAETLYYSCNADGSANLNRQAKLPPRLGSHNDQQLIWQSSNPEGASKGWGGFIADQTGGSLGNKVFSSISVAGNTVFLTGASTIPYQVTTANSLSVPLGSLRTSVYGSTAVANVLGQIITGQGVTTGQAVLERDLTTVVRRAISADDVLRNIARQEGDATYAPLNALSGGIDLARQLRTVAHLIRNRDKLGAAVGRQVFFVQIGSFDTHSGQNADHPWLLRQLSQSLNAFQQVLTNLGVQNNVTTFTASDFGRTFNSNGDGTDHGWGSTHFIMGGAVKGKKFYGKVPQMDPALPSPDGANYYDDNGRGRLIPSTSVDQYAATLARWMGVPDAQLPSVLPNIGNYTGVTGWGNNLGFLA